MLLLLFTFAKQFASALAQVPEMEDEASSIASSTLISPPLL
jgi:hypothetical protein